MTYSCYDMFCVNYFTKTLCSEVYDMQISEAAGGAPAPGAEPCRFPKLEECAHFHYERVQLPQITVTLQTNMDQSLHSQHNNEVDENEWYMVQVTSGDECWLLQRNFENFQMLDDQLHQCIYDRKISQLPDLSSQSPNAEDLEEKLILYLERFSKIADNSVNCGPVLNWLQMDNKGHRLLVPSEESRSINTPAVAAAYSVRRYVSQARDELNLEVGDMISVIDMASPGESMWWRGKRGFQVGFFPQHCVHIIGDKIPRNMPLPPPVVGSLAITPIKPVLRKHGKLITFFRSFILNRPSRRRLKQSGILKERVFGCDLGEHLLNSGHDIPMVLKCCAEFIETNGIVDGIYRLSGVTSNIQKLRNAFDEDRIPNLYTEEILQDIHSVASLLKMYFRELPNPLCTYQLYQSFVNAVQGCSTAVRNSESDHERLLKMRESVQKLPPPHYRTLEYLTRHLARVAKHGASTGMTTRNVAIVWAPNLLRCADLEVGGVAALQGVGVQAVVTEFLICYADLIFCDRLPNFDHPILTAEMDDILSKKCRPNSLAISTPTKLITLEEARTKHNLSKTEECNYIEVGGGPKNLPKKYHTVIEWPQGARKRGHNTKRSPMGWRLFFSRNRNNSQGSLPKNRKASTPMTINDKSITESDLTDMKRKLRSVKSAESLTSGHSEPASCEDVLGPLHSLNKPPGHNRSVSHDSYFDTLQSSQNNSEGSLLDLSEIQLNFELEESEMRIFSEDESLVSSPKVQKDAQRRVLTRARPEEFSSATNSVNPSPKKQPRVVLSPESLSRKRTRLEDQLSDIQFIDCNTPDNLVSTTAVIHTLPESPISQDKQLDSYQPKNKSPRNSDHLEQTKRQSLNLETTKPRVNMVLPKSFTEMDIGGKYLGAASIATTPTPQSPSYMQLGESSANTTPGISPDYHSSPTETTFQSLTRGNAISSAFENKDFKTSKIPNYENVLTTINITYKSPPRSLPTTPIKGPMPSINSVYENIMLNPEKAVIPTSTASLPIQQASQPDLQEMSSSTLVAPKEERPKSLSALDNCSSNKHNTAKQNLSVNAVCDSTSEQISLTSLNETKTLSTNESTESVVNYTPSLSSTPYHVIENSERLSPTDLSDLSEVVQSSSENLNTSQTSISFPLTPSKNSMSPNVSPTVFCEGSSADLLTPTSPAENTRDTSEGISTENLDTCTTSALLEHTAGVEDSPFPRPLSINLIDFSPCEPSPPQDDLSRFSVSQNDKRKSSETETLDDNAVYQQVKYFRRSIHEVNALLDLDKTDTEVENKSTNKGDSISENTNQKLDSGDEEENFDSLEPQDVHVYENVEGESMRGDDSVYENVSFANKTEDSVVLDETTEVPKLEKVSVRDLTSKFEEIESVSLPVSVSRHCSDDLKKPSESVLVVIGSDNRVECLTNNIAPKPKKYEKDGLPPCLRARNLKHQLKTRSLDEEEFEKEFGRSLGNPPRTRRSSMDEMFSHKTNSLPKTLNQPKMLPADGDPKLESIHLAHSSENIGSAVEEEQKKRERIEKYKEERRKFLHDKYRSESFKEDKDVLKSRLKIFRTKEEMNEPKPQNNDFDRPPRTRTRSTRSEDDTNDNASENDVTSDSLEEQAPAKIQTPLSQPKKTDRVAPIEQRREPITKPMKDSLKSRAAIFEQQPMNQRISATQDQNRNNNHYRSSKQETEPHAKNLQDTKPKICTRPDRKRNDSDDDLKGADFMRIKNKDVDLRDERRRHTFETRERESETDKIRRISLETKKSPRREKTPASYCIKDMKAIFESKSKQ